MFRWLLKIGICVSGLLLTSLALADIYYDTLENGSIVISSAPQSDSSERLAEPVEAEPPAIPSVSTMADTAPHLPYHNEVLAAAAATALEPALIHAVIAVESGHNPSAVSKKGAVGLMQLMPDTLSRFNVVNRRDPQQNILAGAKYLRELRDAYHGDLSLMLAAYNAGPKAVERYHGQIPPYAETQQYVPKVLRAYQRFSRKSG